MLLSGLCASMAYDQLAGTDPAGEDTGISTEKMDAAIKAMSPDAEHWAQTRRLRLGSGTGEGIDECFHVFS